MSASRSRAIPHRYRHRPSFPARSFEFLIVLVIVLILLLLAVPTYLGFMSRADSAAARTNLRSALASDLRPGREAERPRGDSLEADDDDLLRVGDGRREELVPGRPWSAAHERGLLTPRPERLRALGPP